MKTVCFFESLFRPTYHPFCAMIQGRSLVVEYASAERLSRQHNCKVEDANHFEVCQPPDKHHISYEKLVDIVKLCIRKVSPYTS